MTAKLPEPPANVAPFVEALGVDDAVALFLNLGGTEVYLPAQSSRRSMAARTIGADKVDALARVLGHGYYRVPVANTWIAQVMRARGATNAEIARTLRVDVSTVRKWLPAQDGPSRQLDFFSRTG
ncbi:helix-turn-helix domain-containing protein [Polymorphum gilvum]|uniref:Uncharacterized protein n=1 Tax=Polymorphum gilvum (strain LMG 25793 / CGMCC 1.9160 / SL003B-26A1) TaxID=991905 RepID=F2J5L6_POLGS|nr:helix-turn-helix domain-containing protein [Polymorphum gilvum]ADZ70100.1 hypothetical protein SL003B_1672 [Polymorphum gilvum SL003B-26A1]